MSEIEREVILPGSPAEIWEELTDAERLGDWFGAGVDGNLAPGEIAVFHFPDGTQRRALVERVEPLRRLSFRWLPTANEPASRVEIAIDEAEDGTALRVVERRIEAAVSPAPRIGFRPLARI